MTIWKERVYIRLLSDTWTACEDHIECNASVIGVFALTVISTIILYLRYLEPQLKPKGFVKQDFSFEILTENIFKIRHYVDFLTQVSKV